MRKARPGPWTDLGLAEFDVLLCCNLFLLEPPLRVDISRMPDSENRACFG